MTGTDSVLTPRGSVTMQDFSHFDDELENVREGLFIGGTTPTPTSEPTVSFGSAPSGGVNGVRGGKSEGNDTLKLAARVVSSHGKTWSYGLLLYVYDTVIIDLAISSNSSCFFFHRSLLVYDVRKHSFF